MIGLRLFSAGRSCSGAPRKIPKSTYHSAAAARLSPTPSARGRLMNPVAIRARSRGRLICLTSRGALARRREKVAPLGAMKLCSASWPAPAARARAAEEAAKLQYISLKFASIRRRRRRLRRAKGRRRGSSRAGEFLSKIEPLFLSGAAADAGGGKARAGSAPKLRWRAQNHHRSFLAGAARRDTRDQPAGASSARGQPAQASPGQRGQAAKSGETATMIERADDEICCFAPVTHAPSWRPSFAAAAAADTTGPRERPEAAAAASLCAPL